MKRLILGAGLYFLLAVNTVFAQDEAISTVRKAAIEKMQAKLGTLRGSIDENSPDIFLTVNMIDRLKPIRPGDHIEAQEKAGGFVVPHNQTLTPDIQTISTPNDRPERNLYKAAGYMPEDNS